MQFKICGCDAEYGKDVLTKTYHRVADGEHHDTFLYNPYKKMNMIVLRDFLSYYYKWLDLFRSG